MAFCEWKETLFSSFSAIYIVWVLKHLCLNSKCIIYENKLKIIANLLPIFKIAFGKVGLNNNINMLATYLVLSFTFKTFVAKIYLCHVFGTDCCRAIFLKQMLRVCIYALIKKPYVSRIQ